METYHDLVRRIVNAFEAAGFDYAFTGALAASFYGLPRTTTDIHVIVRFGGANAKSKLVDTLKRFGMKADEREINRALTSGYRIVKFTDTRTAYTVDIILSRRKLEKRAGTVAGVQAFFQTPEDLISTKLRVIKATEPREKALKDEEDVIGILKFTDVDVEAIKKKAKKDTTLSIFKALTVIDQSIED